MLFVFPEKDGRVTGRTETLPESQMDHPLLSPYSLLSLSLFYASCWKQPTSLMWPFSVCGMRTKELLYLGVLSLLSLSFSLSRTFSIPLCLYNLSYDSTLMYVLMISFAITSDL